MASCGWMGNNFRAGAEPAGVEGNGRFRQSIPFGSDGSGIARDLADSFVEQKRLSRSKECVRSIQNLWRKAHDGEAQPLAGSSGVRSRGIPCDDSQTRLSLCPPNQEANFSGDD